MLELIHVSSENALFTRIIFLGLSVKVYCTAKLLCSTFKPLYLFLRVYCQSLTNRSPVRLSDIISLARVNRLTIWGVAFREAYLP